MTLRDLMGSEAPEVEISALAYSSDSVTNGALFFCVPGFTKDGHDFAPQSVARGAAALVTERRLDLGVPELVVDDVRAAMGPAAARFYGNPTAELARFRPRAARPLSEHEKAESAAIKAEEEAVELEGDLQNP